MLPSMENNFGLIQEYLFWSLYSVTRAGFHRQAEKSGDNI